MSRRARDVGRHDVPRSPARRLVLLVALAMAPVAASSGVGALAGAPGPTSGTGGGATGDVVDIAAVSPWVDPVGTFQVRFAPSTRVPADAVLTWTVHQRLRPDDLGLRGAVDAVLDGGPPGPTIRPPEEVPISQLGDPAQGLVLDIPVRTARDGSERVLLPNPGIHPVTLRLSDAAGAELWEDVVFLNRLPADPVVGADDRPGVVSVSLVLPVDAGPTITATGSTDIDVEERAAAIAAQRLVTEVPEAPLALAVRPNLLSGLAASGEAADERALQAFAQATTVVPVRQTYVGVDAAGLVQAGATSDFRDQTSLGTRVTAQLLGSQPDGTTWWLDDTISPAVLPVLAADGVRRVVVSPDRLRIPASSPPYTAVTRTSALEGTELTALGTDGEMTLRLVASGQSPGYRAHAVVTDLMASWFTAAESATRSFPGPATALLVPPQTDPAALRALVASLSAGGPLTTSPAAVPARAAQVDGRTLTATLAPRDPGDQSPAVATLAQTRQLVDGYRSMTGDADPALLVWQQQGAETLSVRADAGTRTALNQSIRDQVTARVDRIEAPPQRRVVLTSRRATIPLRFRNGLDFPARILLRVRSPRLDVEGPDRRTVVLAPGENRIDLPVTVQAPGESLLRIEVTSPDGEITIPAEPLPVASSTISGVGAALSVLSLLFLAAWWFRTHRRNRRERARAAHPAEGRLQLPPAPAARPMPPVHTGTDAADADEPTLVGVEAPPYDRPDHPDDPDPDGPDPEGPDPGTAGDTPPVPAEAERG